MPVSSAYRTVCYECKAYCCTLVTPPVTENEKQQILSAGFPDFFEKKTEDLYIIKSNSSSRNCPFLKDDYSCSIHRVKPLLCKLWPVIPQYKNKKRGCIVIFCPLFPFLSKETIQSTKKEAKQVPFHLIKYLWTLSPEMKEKYKKFTYQHV